MAEYTMRPLQTKDIFAMSKILKKMNLREETKELFAEIPDTNAEETSAKQKELGVKLVLLIAENIGSAQDEVNAFLANLVGIEAKDFEALPLEDTFEIFKLFKEQKGLTGFFKLAGQ